MQCIASFVQGLSFCMCARVHKGWHTRIVSYHGSLDVWGSDQIRSYYISSSHTRLIRCLTQILGFILASTGVQKPLSPMP